MQSATPPPGIYLMSTSRDVCAQAFHAQSARNVKGGLEPRLALRYDHRDAEAAAAVQSWGGGRDSVMCSYYICTHAQYAIYNKGAEQLLYIAVICTRVYRVVVHLETYQAATHIPLSYIAPIYGGGKAPLLKYWGPPCPPSAAAPEMSSE